MTNQRPNPPRRRIETAFTMIEVLVATAVVAILASMVAAGVQGSLKAADRATEMNAARQLITAYQVAAAENDGRYLAGYQENVTEPVVLRDGRILSGPTLYRYPYRLAPYLEDQVDGTLFFEDRENLTHSSFEYSASLNPALGMNTRYVGGRINSRGELENPTEVISRSSQAARIIAFATAWGTGDGGVVDGFHDVKPPRTTGPEWTSAAWSENSTPNSFGHVHARHNGKALCIFLDGSLELLAIEDLRDMRLWNKNAAMDDNPNYTAASSTPTGNNGRR